MAKNVLDHINIDLDGDGKKERYDLSSNIPISRVYTLSNYRDDSGVLSAAIKIYDAIYKDLGYGIFTITICGKRLDYYGKALLLIYSEQGEDGLYYLCYYLESTGETQNCRITQTSLDYLLVQIDEAAATSYQDITICAVEKLGPVGPF